ncbi:MAG TPA: hypothetical protein VII87_09560 [Solirubrobacteraceae bacterium]
MARSASHRTRATRVFGAAAVAALAGAIVAGCSTTQEEAARLQLNSARIRASQAPTRVTVAGNTVQVARLALVPGRSGTAFVVQVHNPGTRAVSDLPISVGVREGHKRRFLNVQSQSEFSYYEAHLPVIAAGATLTWVYASGRRLSRHARPFVAIGAAPSVPSPRTARLPVIRASVSRPTAAGAAARSPLAIVLHNESAIPQYQLQIYAYAEQGHRYVAAGNVTVAHLGSLARQTATLPLLGDPINARLEVEALPTIVH